MSYEPDLYTFECAVNPQDSLEIDIVGGTAEFTVYEEGKHSSIVLKTDQLRKLIDILTDNTKENQ